MSETSRRIGWIASILAGLLLVAGVAVWWRGSMRGAPEQPPAGSVADLRGLRDRRDLNVVFIVLDTLRADHLGAYGYRRKTSPTIDLLAGRGIRFAHVSAPSSWTKSSMASIWTGLAPGSHGVLRYPHGLPEDATTPAEILRDAGFYTAGIWRNGWVASNFGFGQGFDLYHRPASLSTPEFLQRQTVSSWKLGGSDDEITTSAVEFLKGVGQQRFLLYLHYMDIHQYVYDDSADFGTTFLDFYDNAIAWVDRNLNALFGSMQERGLLGRTLVVITADHGESFLEHGSEGHARTLYTEVQDVPLILIPPFVLDRGVVVEPRVQSVDIWPTVLDLLGMPGLPAAQGVSLLPAIEAAANGPASGERTNDRDRVAIAELDRSWGTTGAEPKPLLSVTDGPYRLVQYESQPQFAELYDHRSDPGEQKNLARELPEVADRLRQRLTEYRSLPEAPWGKPLEVEIDAMRLEQLRALGYAVGADGSKKEPEK